MLQGVSRRGVAADQGRALLGPDSQVRQVMHDEDLCQGSLRHEVAGQLGERRGEDAGQATHFRFEEERQTAQDISGDRCRATLLFLGRCGHAANRPLARLTMLTCSIDASS